MQVESDDPETARLLAQLTAPRRHDEARGHHTISDFYLKRFADDNEWLAVVDLTGPRPRRDRRKTKNVSVVNDFYTFIDSDGGESPTVERLLSEIEGRAAASMRRLATGIFFPPGRQDRVDLSMWLAFQLMPGPETRRQYQALTDVTGKLLVEGIKTPKAARARLRAAGTEEPTEKEISDLLYFTSHLDQFDIVPDPNEHIQLMLNIAAYEIAPRLHSMRWSVAKFDQPALLSGDHPITFFVAPEHHNPLYGVGLATADELRFPVDPSTMLLMTWEPIAESVGSLPMIAAREFNQHTLSNAFEFVFMHPGQDHLAGLRLGTRPRVVLQVDGATRGRSSDGVNTPPTRLRPRRRRRHL